MPRLDASPHRRGEHGERRLGVSLRHGEPGLRLGRLQSNLDVVVVRRLERVEERAGARPIAALGVHGRRERERGAEEAREVAPPQLIDREHREGGGIVQSPAVQVDERERVRPHPRRLREGLEPARLRERARIIDTTPRHIDEERTEIEQARPVGHDLGKARGERSARRDGRARLVDAARHRRDHRCAEGGREPGGMLGGICGAGGGVGAGGGIGAGRCVEAGRL